MNIIRSIFVFFVMSAPLFAEETILSLYDQEIKNSQQIFLFGQMNAVAIEDLPDVGVMYRSKTLHHGYDIVLNQSQVISGGEVVATYNFYALTEEVQPYLGMGGGVGVKHLSGNTDLFGVVPIFVGLNSKGFFADVGIASYLTYKNFEKPYNPVALIKPQARIGLGFSF